MKTFTDAERYQALRQFAILTMTNPERAEEIEESLPDASDITDEAAFAKACDALCEVMQAENQKTTEQPETEKQENSTCEEDLSKG